MVRFKPLENRKHDLEVTLDSEILRIYNLICRIDHPRSYFFFHFQEIFKGSGGVVFIDEYGEICRFICICKPFIMQRV